jgi:hypothetical protein
MTTDESPASQAPKESCSGLSPIGPRICLLPVSAPDTGGDTVASTPTEVADLLDMVAQANDRLTCAVDRLLGTRAAVSHRTIDRLVQLADDRRPGAAARAELRQLADLDTGLLLAGMSHWLAKRRDATSAAATARAAARWGGLSA